MNFRAVKDEIEVGNAARDRQQYIIPWDVVLFLCGILSGREQEENEYDDASDERSSFDSCFPVEQEVDQYAIDRESNH